MYGKNIELVGLPATEKTTIESTARKLEELKNTIVPVDLEKKDTPNGAVEKLDYDKVLQKIGEYLDRLISNQEIPITPKGEIVIIYKESVIKQLANKVMNNRTESSIPEPEINKKIEAITFEDVQNPIYYKTNVAGKEIYIKLAIKDGDKKKLVPYVNIGKYLEYRTSREIKGLPNNIITNKHSENDIRLRAKVQDGQYDLYEGKYIN